MLCLEPGARGKCSQLRTLFARIQGLVIANPTRSNMVRYFYGCYRQQYSRRRAKRSSGLDFLNLI